MTDNPEAIPQSSKPTVDVNALTFLLQVSRPGLWTTTLLFYLMPLGRKIDIGAWPFWVGLTYILFPLGFLLYGVNDIVDAETDKLNPRKGTYLFGARGGAAQLSALRWKILAVQIPFLGAFYFFVGARILWWFATLLLAVLLYNARPFAWKGRPPFDVLIQSSYLLVFVLSSWLNGVPQLPWQTFVFGALFAMHSHIFGEVMDIEPDQESGRETTATRIGRVPAKILIALMLFLECALIAEDFGDRAIVGFLALGVIWFLLDALFLWKNRNYSPLEMRLFMFGWNVVAVIGIFWNWQQENLVRTDHLLGR